MKEKALGVFRKGVKQIGTKWARITAEKVKKSFKQNKKEAGGGNFQNS